MEDKVFTYLIEAYKTAKPHISTDTLIGMLQRFNHFPDNRGALTGFFLNIWFNIQLSSKSSQACS